MNQIRGTHPYHFRSGEWADLIAIDEVSQGVPSPRRCYFVAFQDGVTDLWPIEDRTAGYEFREVTT